MKRFFLVAILLCVAFDTWSQFRRSRERESQPVQEGTLNYANPAEYTIAGIEVTGIEILDKNAMISISGLKIGDKIKIPGDDISGLDVLMNVPVQCAAKGSRLCPGNGFGFFGGAGRKKNTGNIVWISNIG